MLIARVKDDDFQNEKHYQKYNVLVEKDELIFYKSLKTGRWWIEIPFLPDVNNKLKSIRYYLACMTIMCVQPKMKYQSVGIKPTGRTSYKIYILSIINRFINR